MAAVSAHSLRARHCAEVPGLLPPGSSQGPGGTGACLPLPQQGSRSPLHLPALPLPDAVTLDTGLSVTEADDSLTCRVTELTSSRAGCQPSTLACPHPAAPNSDHTPWGGGDGEEHGSRAPPDPQDLASSLGRACPGEPIFPGCLPGPHNCGHESQRGSQWVEGTCSHPQGAGCCLGGDPAPQAVRRPLRTSAVCSSAVGFSNSGHVVPTPARPQTQFGVKALLISQSGSHLL